MNRLFFALDINQEDKNSLEEWRNTYKNIAFKKIDIDNLHITLCFLGLVNTEQKLFLIKNAEKISALIRPIKPQKILINGYGLFGKAKVLYVNNQLNPIWLLSLAKLLKDIATEQKIYQESRAFFPHISLYRKANNIDCSLLLHPPKIEITITSFSLYESISSVQGVKYKSLHSWPLVNE